MLARNAIIYIFTGITPDALEAAVARRPFQPCGAFDANSRGFITPVKGQEGLVRFAGNVASIAMREDDKILPACVVTDETRRQADEIEEQQGHRIGRKQMKELKERVTEELRAKAFVRTTVVRAWLDFDAGLLVIDTASESKVDNLTGTLLRHFDELPELLRWFTNDAPIAHFTNWVQTGEAPDGFTIDDRALLTNTEGGKVRLTNQSMVADEVRNLIENSRTCVELAITHAEKLSFVLTHNLTLKRIDHLGINEERDPAQADMLEEERHDAEIILNAGAVREAFDAINDAMGDRKIRGEAPAATSPDAEDGPMYEQAKQIVIDNSRPSISLVLLETTKEPHA